MEWKQVLQNAKTERFLPSHVYDKTYLHRLAVVFMSLEMLVPTVKLLTSKRHLERKNIVDFHVEIALDLQYLAMCSRWGSTPRPIDLSK
jgi:hypothetical protein